MESEINKRADEKPESLKLIAWFLIIISALILLRSIQSQIFDLAAGLAELNSGDQDFFLELTDTILIVIWIAYYIVLLISSIHLLQLKLWALETVEFLTWLYLVCTFLILTLPLFPIGYRSLENFGLSPDSESGESVGDSMRTFLLIVKGIGIAVAIVILLCLRGKTIKKAFSHSTSKSV